MLYEIKTTVEKELNKFIREDKTLGTIKQISPLLFNRIKDFISRPGKRIRPVLFIIGYRGWGKKIPSGLYKCALSFELLHDFFLIHDDIVDKSDTRRGKPSMHKMFDSCLRTRQNNGVSGQDLALIAADAVYAMAANAFNAIKINRGFKEKAFEKFTQAAAYTSAGEFIELLSAVKPLKEITEKEIYTIYDYKTARYTFIYPIITGAILAGAGKKQINTLFEYGLNLGRAFQIRDDIYGLFGDEKITGKSGLTDLREKKKTLLIWHAYNNSPEKNKKAIDAVFAKKTPGNEDLNKMRRLLEECGSREFAQKSVTALMRKALDTAGKLSVKTEYKKILMDWPKEILGFEKK